MVGFYYLTVVGSFQNDYRMYFVCLQCSHTGGYSIHTHSGGNIIYCFFFFQMKKVIAMDIHTFLSLRFRNVDTGEMRQVLGI